MQKAIYAEFERDKMQHYSMNNSVTTFFFLTQQ